MLRLMMPDAAGAAEAAGAAPGHGRLRVIRAGGRSRVSAAYATSPLRLLTPQNHGHAAWIYTSSYGGGLVDGDAIALDLEVGAGASAFVSTQASTKGYRSPRGTSSELRARVEEDGLLVLAPDPVVCFTSSRYRQAQQFELARGAALVAVDWMSSGRRASGERWAFDEYDARLSVRVEGRLLVHDRLRLSPEEGVLAARMGRFEVIAILAIVGTALRHEAAAVVARLGVRPIERRADLLLAATPLVSANRDEAGCVIRVAGLSVEQVGRALRACLDFVPPLLGDDPWTRKW